MVLDVYVNGVKTWSMVDVYVNGVKTWSMVCFVALHMQFSEEARSHLYIDKWNKQVNLSQAF